MAGGNVNLSDLCVSCGLCCTGAIFSHAKLTEDDKAILADAGVSQSDGVYVDDRLPLPCHFLSGTACTIYDQGRPKICGEYLCKLVRDVDAGKTSMDEAKQVAAEARQLLAEASEVLPTGTNIVTGGKALLSDELPEGVSKQAAMQGRLAYFALQALIDKRFRAKDQKLIKISQD